MENKYKLKVVERYMKLFYSEQAIRRRFHYRLTQMCNNYNIPIRYFETTKQLNEFYWGENYNKDNMAVGVHVYNILNKQAKIGISLENDSHISDSVWVLAHELGHNYAIRFENDRTEKTANRYIDVLAQLCLDEFEYCMLKSSIMIYSHLWDYHKEGYKFDKLFIKSYTQKYLKREEIYNKLKQKYNLERHKKFSILLNKIKKFIWKV